MFRSLHLGNFKAFSATQKIPLKPLTIIFGPNSAGKSSLIHGLLFAHEAATSDESDNLNVRRPRIGGDAVDLGGFRQFVHHRNAESRVEWGVTLAVHELNTRLKELLQSVAEVTVTAQIGLTASKDREQVLVNSYEISTDGRPLLRASLKRRHEGMRLGLDELDTGNPVVFAGIEALVLANTWTEKLNEKDVEIVNDAIDELVPLLDLSHGPFLPRGVASPANMDTPHDAQVSLFPTFGNGSRNDQIAGSTRLMLPRLLNEVVAGLTTHIEQTLRKTRYLGPLRSYPSRHLAFSQEYDTNWFAGGGYAWDRVRLDKAVRDKVNVWLGSEKRMKTPYELRVTELVSPEQNYDAIWDGLEEVLKELSQPETDGLTAEEAKEFTSDSSSDEYDALDLWDSDSFTRVIQKHLSTDKVEKIYDLVLFDRRSGTIVSHRDVGIGISQVLPVLVSAYGSDGSVVAMEQPELHLHPALQAELGDVFIESAKRNGNSFLLETHSEHLILRLMRRIRETTAKKSQGRPGLTSDDVCLLYMKPEASGSELVHLRLDKYGRLADPCPDGFFEEDFRELF